MSTRLQKMKQSRIDKLEALRELGVDPYPANTNRTHTVADALDSNGEVTVVGRLMSWRGHGQMQFADVQDETGRVQLAFKSDVLSEKQFDQLSLFSTSDFIQATGERFETKTGEPSIKVTEYKIICKTIKPLPSQWHGFKNVDERFRKRYLDLIINPQVKKTFETRSKVVSSIRNFLESRGFIEIETPTLQPVYGGGFARPFSTHHNALDVDFYLRISDEMYLKRLIVGGFEKVFEITKVFRNEGIDHDHNPEFTMFEAQIAYEDYFYGMDVIEEIMEQAAVDAIGTTEVEYQGRTLSLKRPWERMRVVEAVEKFTGVNPLDWRTTKEAEKAIRSMEQIRPDKLEELKKMNTVGEMIAFAFEEVVEDQLIQPTIIYDYPIEVSPLAKKCEDPRFTQRFEMFAFGSELGNNYSELNDPIDLTRRFVEEKKKEEAGFDEAHQTDYDYLDAIEHGFPPTCGIAIGIDRFVMMLTNSASIREVIAFPTLRPKNPVDVGAPKKEEVNPKTRKASSGDKSAAKLPPRKDSEALLEKYVENPNLRHHCRMVAQAMEAYAEVLDEDAEMWYQAGLLHDLDWEKYPDEHPNRALTELLVDYPQELLDAIAAHAPDRTGKHPQTLIERYLFACDELSGFLHAYSLMRPAGFSGMKAGKVNKRLKDKSFAANVNRDDIREGFEVIEKEPVEHITFLIQVFETK